MSFEGNLASRSAVISRFRPLMGENLEEPGHESMNSHSTSAVHSTSELSVATNMDSLSMEQNSLHLNLKSEEPLSQTLECLFFTWLEWAKNIAEFSKTKHLTPRLCYLCVKITSYLSVEWSSLPGRCCAKRIALKMQLLYSSFTFKLSNHAPVHLRSSGGRRRRRAGLTPWRCRCCCSRTSRFRTTSCTENTKHTPGSYSIESMGADSGF